jgi:hypothetical protein
MALRDEAVKLIEIVQAGNLQVSEMFKPFQNYEYLKDFPSEARQLMMAQHKLSEVMGIAMEILVNNRNRS